MVPGSLKRRRPHLPVVLAKRLEQARELEEAVRDGVEPGLAHHLLQLGVRHLRRSRSLNRNIPHPSTYHSPSIGIYLTRRLVPPVLRILGLDTAITPLLSRSTTGEFSPPKTSHNFHPRTFMGLGTIKANDYM
eukprot:4756398-Pyramimonas_sp.AAC.2